MQVKKTNATRPNRYMESVRANFFPPEINLNREWFEQTEHRNNMNVSFIWMIRVMQWTSIFLTLKNFDVSDFNDHVIVNVAILKIFSFGEDVLSVSCFGFTKNGMCMSPKM